MATGSITSWQIDGEKVGTMADFRFFGSKITADDHSSHEKKKKKEKKNPLAAWKKNYDKPRESIKKQRYHFADKGPYSQSYGVPVVM